MVRHGCWSSFLRHIDLMKSEFVKGSSWFAIKAVEAVTELIECMGDKLKQSTLNKAIDAIESVNPSMATLSNVANIIRHYINDPQSLLTILNRLKEHVTISTSLVAEVFESRNYGFNHVLTLSYSATVLELGREGLVSRFTVLESRPGSEGVVMCSELNRYVKAELVPDLMAREVINKVDAVIVGADSICSDGYVINKLGTYLLATIAKDAGKPFIVVADSLKATKRTHKEVVIPTKECEIGMYVIKYPVFDATPPNLITELVTDVGAFKPREGISDELFSALVNKLSRT